MRRITTFSLLFFSLLLAACSASENPTDLDIAQFESTSTVQVVEEPTPVIDFERVEFVSADGTVIVGRIILPEGKGPFPAFVYVHGSGAVTRNQGGGSVVTALTDAGYAVLMYDKRGVGESGGSYSQVGPVNSRLVLGELAEDASAGAEFLAELDVIDPNNIGLFGNSQAGWIIPAAAVGADEVSFAVILVGPAVSVGEEIFYSGLTQENSNTLTDEKQITVAERLAEFSGQAGYNPRSSIAKVNIPMLWVLGGKDASIPTAETVEILNEISFAGDKDFTVHVYPLGTHGLQNAETGEQFNFMDEVVLGWIADVLK